MKQTARIISTYSADAFGVCSALFELGGMTVMHDASGCNSTYTTHDEPRWYDMDSMVYISGLSEMEAIMGDDEKLIDDIADAASELKPEFIAICGTPIPMMTGFDFEAVAEVIESRTGIPTFGFPTSGMNTYIHGAFMALEGIAKRFVKEPSAERSEVASAGEHSEASIQENSENASAGEHSEASIQENSENASWQDYPEEAHYKVNILGLTPLDFSVNGTDLSLEAWLKDNGFRIVSKWAMGSSLEEISNAADADVNLIVSAAGLGAGRTLYRNYGIPGVIGLPIGEKQSEYLRAALRRTAAESRACSRLPESISAAGITRVRIHPNDLDPVVKDELVVLIGEGITNFSLANAIRFETGRKTRVVCATECPEGILREWDVMAPDEDDIIPWLSDASYIIADPLYKPICPDTAKFIELPAESFSGRIYRDRIPDLIKDPGAILNQL